MKVESESESEVTQLCPTLNDATDCSPPGSSIHGIFQARVLIADMSLNLWVELLIAVRAFVILKLDLKSTSSISRDLPGGGITGSPTQIVLAWPGTLPVS